MAFELRSLTCVFPVSKTTIKQVVYRVKYLHKKGVIHGGVDFSPQISVFEKA